MRTASSVLLLLFLAAGCARPPAHLERTVPPEPCRSDCSPTPLPDPEPLTWQAASGPRSYGIAAGLFVHGERIVISGYGRVLLSDDAGASWTEHGAPEGQLFDVVEADPFLLVDDTFTGELD